MPKVVDHEQRREELVAALWRLVMRSGVEAASMRSVAAEAGWSPGSLRHYFSTQSELAVFAMELVARRVATRIEALPHDEDARGGAERLLHELLPLDAERRAETQVWLAFTARALVDPSLRALRDRAHHALRGLCEDAVKRIGTPDPRAEAERLHALVDGLALHAILAPGVTTAERQRRLLALHLDGLR